MVELRNARDRKRRELTSWIVSSLVFATAIFHEIYIDGSVVTIHGERPALWMTALFVVVVSALLKMFFKSFYSKDR